MTNLRILKIKTGYDRNKMGHLNLLSEQDIHAMFTHKKGNPAGNYIFKVDIETLEQGVKYVQS